MKVVRRNELGWILHQTSLGYIARGPASFVDRLGQFSPVTVNLIVAGAAWFVGYNSYAMTAVFALPVTMFLSLYLFSPARAYFNVRRGVFMRGDFRQRRPLDTCDAVVVMCDDGFVVDVVDQDEQPIVTAWMTDSEEEAREVEEILRATMQP